KLKKDVRDFVEKYFLDTPEGPKSLDKSTFLEGGYEDEASVWHAAKSRESAHVAGGDFAGGRDFAGVWQCVEKPGAHG
ncbi:hypothetical protein, partial [Geobacillus sp. Manikaran-105]|uniref:hypothetical protein n=1 Tax=Geobacillus sp. Manikaran-105 TaxID=2055940 RepID=UPI001E4F6A92